MVNSMPLGPSQPPGIRSNGGDIGRLSEELVSSRAGGVDVNAYNFFRPYGGQLYTYCFDG